MIAKISSIGDDLSKDKPALNEAVKVVFDVGGAEQVARWPSTRGVRRWTAAPGGKRCRLAGRTRRTAACE